jgi:hypothetical protein
MMTTHQQLKVCKVTTERYTVYTNTDLIGLELRENLLEEWTISAMHT